MLASFRRLSKSKIGTGIMAVVLLAILGGFALADLSNFGTGIPGFGLPGSTLAKVGGEEIGERDMEALMQRHLQQVQQQNPSADNASIAGDLDPLLGQMIDQAAFVAFADKYGFRISKRMLDAEIIDALGVRGLNGKPDVQAYQQVLARIQLTDAQVRQRLSADLAARYLTIPIMAAPQISSGVATPYAQMLLEEREGEAAVVPFTAFTAGLKPTDAQLQQYVNANRARYTVPEQRVIRFARIGAEQVGNVAATDQEIETYYKSNQAAYAAKETRNLTQVVVPDQAAANAIAARAKGGQPLAKAAAGAAVSALKGQTRQQYASVAGDKVAAGAFSAGSGAIVGPIQSDFGWAVVKIDSVTTTPGKSLAEAKAEIAAKLTAEKRKVAVDDLSDKIDDLIEDGRNFGEITTEAKLPVTSTPLMLPNGTSRADPSYKVPPELMEAFKAGFDLAQGDHPELVPLADKSGSVVVAPAEVVPAAVPPLATIRDRVAADWTAAQGLVRARKAAADIAAKTSRGMPLADAIKQSGVALPIEPLKARRLQIAEAKPDVVPALRILFSLPAGKAKMVPDSKGRGFFVVKVSRILPANSVAALQLAGRTQAELRQPTANEYAEQFVAAMREDLKVRRNEKAIQAMKKRYATSGN
jgi:peptidyl-prolyl cis-trans isomerase D